MNCKHCNREFVPKQLYCSTKCRVYDHRYALGEKKPVYENVTQESDDTVIEDYQLGDEKDESIRE
jgi:hypothetical protein